MSHSSCEATKTPTAEERSRASVLLRLKLASALCLVFLVVEVLGGVISGSLTVLSDAAHLLADLASFLVAIGAWYLAGLPATERHTFGFRRVEALAALFSVSSLALVSVMLAIEAVRRLWVHAFPGEGKSPVDVDGRLMAGVATIGVLVNVALAFILGAEGHAHSHGHGGECGHSHGHHGHGHEHVAVGGGAAASAKESNGGHSHDHSHDHVASAKESNGGHSHDHTHDHDRAGEDTPNTRLLSEDHGKTSGVSNESYGTASSGFLHNNEVSRDHSRPPEGGEKPTENLNLSAAYLHVLGDLSMSVAVLIAGLFIWWKPHWQVMDPICTVLFCLVVLYSTVGVFRSSLSVLLEEVPPHISWQEVHDAISAVDGVSDVHCLHIWSISHGVAALSVHVKTDGNMNDALRDIGEVCRGFKIGHATVQVQRTNGESGDCITCEIDGDDGAGTTRSGRDSCMQHPNHSVV